MNAGVDGRMLEDEIYDYVSTRACRGVPMVFQQSSVGAKSDYLRMLNSLHKRELVKFRFVIDVDRLAVEMTPTDPRDIVRTKYAV